MSRPVRIFLSLIAGLVLGALAAANGPVGAMLADVAEPIGGLWLDGLRMTVIPLVVALLVTGIASGADAARAGGVARRTLMLIAAILLASAATAALVTPLLLDLFPLPAASAGALKAALGGSHGAVPPQPGLGTFLRGIVPANVFKSAVEDQMIPVIVFTATFGFAVTRLAPEPRRALTALFQAGADAMLVVIGWVLALAPIGVFALAFTVGARAGVSAAGALLHYILIVAGTGTCVWLGSFALAAAGARIGVGRFVRETLPVQAMAVSTQSSLACLAPMLAASERLGVRAATAGITLPMAVSLLRATGPAMNLAVVLYVARWFGVAVPPATLALGVAVAALTSLTAVSLPGQVSFFLNVVPVANAIGVPLAPLTLLIAVEALPDLMRTLGNVTMDVAVTATVERWLGAERGRARNVDAAAAGETS